MAENIEPKISVVIPVYKAEKYLKECLDSVLAQTLKEIEILCIDDCSPDNCPAILDEYTWKDPRIKVTHLPENHGAFYVRRTGMLQSRGKYVMFLDSDDLYEPNACEKAYELIESAKTDMVNFAAAFFSGEKIDRNPNFMTPKFERLTERNLLKSCYVDRVFTHTMWDKIYNGEIIRQAAALMPEELVPGMEDFVQFFMISTMLKSALAAPKEQLVRFRVGVGESNDLEHAMKTVQIRAFAERWLDAIHDTDKDDRLALEAMMKQVNDRILWTMLKAPQLDAAILRKVGECCGVGMLVRFIEATGLLKVPLIPRDNLCNKLGQMIRQREQMIAKLQSQNQPPTYTIKSTLG